MYSVGCKMCGGSLVITKDRNIARCEHCGRIQTIPQADNARKLQHFDRANLARRNGEFDRAAGLYESIVADFPEEPEAYWGLVLCRYGIEYVDDPKTGQKVPTCHRSSYHSILEDDDFQQACTKADPVARRIYRAEGEALEQLRKNIVQTSSKEPPYDIFLCYKESDENGQRTLDSQLAQSLYNTLTQARYRVFFARISLESMAGICFEPYIFAALTSAPVMIVIGTNAQHFQSVWVKNEWSRFLALKASGQKKMLIPCCKNISPEDLPPEFQPLQAQDLGRVGAVEDLLRGVEKFFAKIRPPKSSETSFARSAQGQLENIVQLGFLDLKSGCQSKAENTFRLALQIDSGCVGALLGLLLCAEVPQTYLAQLLKECPELNKGEKRWITPENCVSLFRFFAKENHNGSCSDRIGWIFDTFTKELDAQTPPPLFFAIKARNPATVQCLLEHGADPLQRFLEQSSDEQDDWSTVSLAVSLKDAGILEVLLRHKADANAYRTFQNAFGSGRITALQEAAIACDPTILRLLAQYGATIDQEPRHYVGKNVEEVIPLLSDVLVRRNGNLTETVQALLELGTPPNACRLHTDKATGHRSQIQGLHDAICMGNVSLVQTLLDAGADIRAKSKIWEGDQLTEITPLAAAILLGTKNVQTAKEIIRLLLEHCASWQDEVVIKNIRIDLQHYPFDLKYQDLDQDFVQFLKMIGWKGNAFLKVCKYLKLAVMIPICIIVVLFEEIREYF